MMSLLLNNTTRCNRAAAGGFVIRTSAPKAENKNEVYRQVLPLAIINKLKNDKFFVFAKQGTDCKSAPAEGSNT
jgi:hypothetical protein